MAVPLRPKSMKIHKISNSRNAIYNDRDDDDGAVVWSDNFDV